MVWLDASDLAQRLGRQAEAVCRHYLSNGRRQGNYWQVGDVRNTPGRSMFVRLKDTPKGPAGKWMDAESGEHGDLLDVIREALGLIDFADVAEEARAFLSLPHPEPEPTSPKQRGASVPSGSAEASRRLFAMARPIAGTIAKAYLRKRGITAFNATDALRFHPQCYYRPDDGPTETWPALLARVTDLAGRQTGTHRTWLAPDGSGKAPIDTQRKAMGDLLGHGVRFGIGSEVQTAGEGIETMLSVRSGLPDLPAVAALSAAHLAALLLPDTLRRLYVARDNGEAGEAMARTLAERAEATGIEAVVLVPTLGDFNDDLRAFGVEGLRAALRAQVLPQDVARFMALAA
ncbi:DNA primase [Xaviernesmea oryzae]|uniref:DNA primase n=1 Tax=Xaviernesmea oryzae TaxID=464029 RepID=A0A1Q9AUB0_9HYPH|nr:toprim domain-containing protein [Xaviernesmea oryzae]OLP58934.1 DNA primase [Xaviernesmea oryzae]SEM01259.1 Toprim domain-containing protein [Xaviernesmea oryzae]